MGSGASIAGSGILGREAEMDLARAALGAVAAESGTALLITGEAGIGKSSLLEMVVDDARDRYRVIAEAASELETDLPFAPLIRGLGIRPDASDPTVAALADLLARPDVADPDLLRPRVIEGIADLLERWALDQPVLVALDDLHWADDATLQLLDRVCRRREHLRVVVAVTARPHPKPAALRTVEQTFARTGAVVVDLAPLPHEVVDELARTIVGAEPGPRLSAALRRAGGNPLHVKELVGASGIEPTADGRVAELPGGSMPGSVRQAILRNISAVPGPTLEMLRMASVLGARFDLRQLALTVDRRENEVIELLRPAFDSGVVSEADGLLAFRHDLVREAVYEDQPGVVRAASHRHVVERLRAARYSVEDQVPHLLRGQWGSVPEAGTWLADAGRVMRARHLPAAAELLARAVELLGEHAGDELRLDHAEVLAASNRSPQEVAAALGPVLTAPPETLSEDTRDRLVQFAGPSAPATDAAARRALLDALEAAGLSERGRVAAMTIRAGLHWLEGGLAEAEELATRALEDGAADPAVKSQLALILARLAEGRGDALGKLQHGRRALELARLVPDQPERSLTAAATLAMMLGTDPADQADADQVLAEAQALADRTGLEHHQATLEAVGAINEDRRGDWEAAVVRYEAAIASFPDVDAMPAGGAQLYARAARVHVHRDELPLAVERVRMGREVAERARATDEGPDELAYVYIAEAELGLALADHGAAAEGLRALAAFVDERDIGLYRVVLLPAITAVALGIDDLEHAEDAVGRAERWIATVEQPDPHVGGLVRWCRALVDGADEPFDQLLAWIDQPRPMWEWKPRMREDAATVFEAAGRRDDAVERLEEALALWDRVGARRDVARVRSSLRHLGVRRGRGQAGDRPSTGWGSLTDAEWRVLDLVGEGLIYREIGERLFISRRTVETHVQHVFQKLGASSRAELARMLATEEGRTHLAAHR